jgi:hypothetical protein
MKRLLMYLVASALLLGHTATARGAKNDGPGVTDTEIEVGRACSKHYCQTEESEQTGECR